MQDSKFKVGDIVRLERPRAACKIKSNSLVRITDVRNNEIGQRYLFTPLVPQGGLLISWHSESRFKSIE